MYYHLGAALFFWGAGLLMPTLPEDWTVSFMIAGIIAFLLFTRELLESVNSRMMHQAAEAEEIALHELSSFKGWYVAVRPHGSSLPEGFTYIVFTNGDYEIPLFCRRKAVVQKAQAANCELIIYYKDYILVDIKEIDEGAESLSSW